MNDSRASKSQDSAEPLVSVVLLSYARPQYLAEALQSVVEQSYPNLEIILVDNRSDFSGEIAAIAGRYPQVRLIASPDNLGFTGGMNLGIRASRGQYLFLTEDDMVLDRNCIREFVAYTARTSEYSLLSGIVLNKADGCIWYAGGHVELGSIFRMTILGKGAPDSGQFSRAFDVNYICGAMVFAPAALLKRLGGFREDFFMYCEDIELCFRSLAQNCRITVVPSARASHFEPIPSTPPESLRYQKVKNWIALYVLHAPPGVILIFLLRNTLSLFASAKMNDIVLWLRALGAVFTAFPRLWRDRRQRTTLAVSPADGQA